MKDKNNIHGFKAPDGYFDDFDERLFGKMEEEKLPRDTGFTVPEGYFNDLEEGIMKNVLSLKEQKEVIPLYKSRTLVYVASIAACIALIYTLATNRESLTKQIDKVQFSSIENYIEEGNLDLDSFDVMALLNDEDVSDLIIENELFSEEFLKDYLLENIEDTTLLIE